VTLAVIVSVCVTLLLLSTHTVTRLDTQLDGDIRDSVQCSVTTVQSTCHVVTHVQIHVQDREKISQNSASLSHVTKVASVQKDMSEQFLKIMATQLVFQRSNVHVLMKMET